MSMKSKSPQTPELSKELIALQSAEESQLPQPEAAQHFLDSYAYFDGESMMDGLHISDGELEQAQALLDEEDYYDFSVEIGSRPEDPDGLPIGQASMDTERGGYALLRFDRKKLLFTTCTDWRCHHYHDEESYLEHTLCVHETALLLLLQEELRSRNPGDATNRSGRLLMMQKPFTETPVQDPKQHDKELTLEPALGLDENGQLYAEFRVGAGRLYKVKDLAELHQAMLTGSALTLGKSTSLIMGSGLVREQDRGYLTLIGSVLQEEQCRADYLRPRQLRYGRTLYGEEQYGYQYTIKDRLPLYGDRLDRFFELAKDRTLAFRRTTVSIYGERSNSKEKISLREKNKKITLQLTAQIDPEDGTFLGISLDGRLPMVVRGLTGVYMVEEEALCRASGISIDQISYLEQIADNGTIHALIGRSNLRQFCRVQLPVLRNLCRVEISEEDQALIASYLPPEAVLIAYLDLQDGNLICKPQAIYGTYVHNVPNLWEKQERGTLETYRDSKREEQLLAVLEEYFSEVDEHQEFYFTEAEDETLYRFLDEGLDQLLSVCEVRSTQRFRRVGIRRSFSMQVGVAIESGLLDLEVNSEELSAEELMEVIAGYHRKERYYRLRSGDFLKLDQNEAVKQLADLMETMHLKPKAFVKGKMHIPAYRALYLDSMLAGARGIYADRARSFKNLIKRFKTIADSDFEVPAQLSKVLRPYQVTGYRWLRTLDENGFGGILADEMGLGKTVQVISVLLADTLESEEHHTSLIVCPASLVYNWGEEISRFAPSLRTMLLVGNQEERANLIERMEEADVVITSYDLLKRDIDQFEDKQFRFEVIDEAQYIKNHTTAASKAVKLIRAQTKYALTGTPIENRLSELWSIFDYLMPGFLYEYASFSRELERPIVRQQDEEASLRLKRMVTPFILRRLKADVLKDLPEKLEQVRYAGMDEEQRRLYEAHVARMKQELAQASEEEVRHNQIQLLSELTQLRQICCDPELLYDDYTAQSAKRAACMDLIRGGMEGGHRMLLFSQFTQMLGLIEADLKQEGIPYYIITGKTDKAKRLELVRAFNEGEVPVFLISLKAGGTGLNLTGADTVIHYDPWWNAAAENQATDRAHRIGQTRVVTVFKLIMKDTIEEKILALQEAKMQLAEDILSSEGTKSTALSRDQLLEILS